MFDQQDARRRLDERGFVVWPRFIDEDLLAAMRASVESVYAAEGEEAGAEFKQEPGSRRLANLVDKGDIFLQLFAQPEILALVRHVLGDDMKLSSMNARSVNPHWPHAQPLHADMGAVADERGFWVCNTVWLLDDFTSENGTLRAVPGSHHLGRLPQDVLADPMAPHADEVTITAQAGDVILMNAHLWHGGLPNRTAHPRRAVHVFYCRGDKPQQQYQKRMVRAEVQSRLSPLQREILALDDLRNDELSNETVVRSGFLK